MNAKKDTLKAVVLALVAITLLAIPVAVGAADAANGITSPKAGAKVSGSVDVTGYANDPSFWKWQLDILPGGDADKAAFLALGNTAGDFSYSLDTTAYPDGEYALRLRVVRADSNYDEFINEFTVANAAAKPAAAPAAAPIATAPAATAPASVTVTKNATLGSFLADATGRTLYLFTKDTPNTSNCYGNCEAAWPPLFTKGAAQAGAGVNASLLGTTTRTDGSVQVTYNSWPLYYFAKDQKPGDVTGQDVGGVWFVISPAGQKVETPTAPAVTKPAAAPAPTANGITNPKDGATVGGAVEVKGNASDPNFARWQLDILPGGDANAAIFLGTGEKPGGFTYILDTTAFPNGEHALRLRVVRADSNYEEFVTRFTIANAAPKAQAFAAGKYLRQGTQDRALQFNKDGTLIALLLPDTNLAEATYRVKGDVYTETSNNQGCISNRNYKYTFDGTKMVFTPLEVYDPATDTCAGRADDFNPNVTWVMFR